MTDQMSVNASIQWQAQLTSFMELEAMEVSLCSAFGIWIQTRSCDYSAWKVRLGYRRQLRKAVRLHLAMSPHPVIDRPTISYGVIIPILHFFFLLVGYLTSASSLFLLGFGYFTVYSGANSTLLRHLAQAQ